MLAALAVVLLFAAPESRFIAADVANVRETASDTAPVIAKLRINTQVQVEAVIKAEAKAGTPWTEIDFGGAAKGFVKAELLAMESLTKDAALAKMRTARDAKDSSAAIRWAERAVAIDPDDRALLESARDLRKSAGLKSGALEEQLAGKGPVFIGLCRGTPSAEHFPPDAPGRIEIVARVKADGMPEEVRSDATPNTLPLDLGASVWWVMSPDGTVERFDGGFPFARWVAVWNEEPSGKGSLDAPGGVTPDQGKVVLGGCAVPGSVWTTARPEAVARAAFDWKGSAALVSALGRASDPPLGANDRVESLAANTISPSLTEARLEVEHRLVPPLPGTSPLFRSSSWGLVGAANSVRTHIGPVEGGTFFGVHDPVWVLLPGGRRTVVVPYARTKIESGSVEMVAVIAVDAKGAVRRIDLEIQGSGC